MSYNINEMIKKAEAEYGLGKGEYLKLKEGDNRIRILSHFVPHQSSYNGKTTFKFVAWVIDRTIELNEDKNVVKIKPFFMSKTIAEYIGALQDNPDYVFYDFPMPYDITINAKGAGTKEVVYTVLPARNHTPLNTEEKVVLNEKMPIAEFVAKLKERDNQASAPQPVQPQLQEPQDSGTRFDDVPFEDPFV